MGVTSCDGESGDDSGVILVSSDDERVVTMKMVTAELHTLAPPSPLRCRRHHFHSVVRIAEQESAACDGVALQLLESRGSRLWSVVVDKRTLSLVEHPN